jgi:type IV pilus assembly protein PilW
MRQRSHLRGVPRQSGFGLVEIMVGVVIALLALLIIYRGLALSEGYRRTTTAGGDAQSAGMISTFLLAQDIQNAGNTIADTAPDLMACPNTGAFATTWRPIPVLITDGGADEVSDQISVFYGVNRRLVTQVDTRVTAPPGSPFQVQSPLGWAVGHMFVITNQVGPLCEVSRVTAVAGPDVNGVVTLTHTGVANTYPQPSWIVNLGPAPLVRKVHYDVVGDTVRMDDLLDAAPPNPITGNVVLLKAQYGIDTSLPPDGTIDAWVNARNAPWTAADVLAAPIAQVRSIKAVRIAMVVRSSQFERIKDAEGLDVTGGATTGFVRTLFPCNALPGCTGEMTNVTIPGTQNYRYRVFEQVIPLRNQIWNP